MNDDSPSKWVGQIEALGLEEKDDNCKCVQ